MDVIEKIKNKEVFDLLIEANKITEKIHGKDVSLERALFLSWWCEKEIVNSVICHHKKTEFKIQIKHVDM